MPMRNLLWGLLLMFPGHEEYNKPLPFSPVESEFPLIWKAKTGEACFRTNVQLSKNDLIIGSNGSYFMDYGVFDKLSGVYVIDRKSGRIQRHFANEKLGDMDVNGVLLYRDRCYFGNDNEEFLCTDYDGNIIWRNPASGDVEHEPVLINDRGRDIVVYATESGEVCAIDPSGGKKVWNYYVPDFSGYKPGDSRNIFKVKSYFSNTLSFYTKPVTVDLNDDGTKDLVYVGYDSKVYALNGRTGELIWLYDSPSSLGYCISLSGTEANPLFTLWKDFAAGDSSYHSHILTLDKNGSVFSDITLQDLDYHGSLNSFRCQDGSVLIATPDYIYLIKDGKIGKRIYHQQKAIVYDTIPNYNGTPSIYERDYGRNTRDMVIGSSEFSYKGHDHCVIIMMQNDAIYYDHGFIEIVSVDSGEIIDRLELPDAAEMPPQLLDVNKDGILDLLVNCRNGYTYCYNMKTPAK